jgi:putative (di)nucleoside polyphosphate hydrolase
MLDDDGYRPNVGIILCNDEGQVLWARRCGRDGWQFPQGGMRQQESPEAAMYRELKEEIGLDAHHVTVMGRTRDWLHYDLPESMRGKGSRARFKGQKQIWFLLRFLGDESDVTLDCADKPEFDDWRWLNYWGALEQIIEFKRDVYRQALQELEPLLTKHVDTETRANEK